MVERLACLSFHICYVVIQVHVSGNNLYGIKTSGLSEVLIYAPVLSPGPQLHMRATDAHVPVHPARATRVLLKNTFTRTHETGQTN
jgi:hypothetical protein